MQSIWSFKGVVETSTDVHNESWGSRIASAASAMSFDSNWQGYRLRFHLPPDRVRASLLLRILDLSLARHAAQLLTGSLSSTAPSPTSSLSFTTPPPDTSIAFPPIETQPGNHRSHGFSGARYPFRSRHSADNKVWQGTSNVMRICSCPASSCLGHAERSRSFAYTVTNR